MTSNRREQAYQVRVSAAALARDRAPVRQVANGDEQRYAAQNYFMSFTKGLPHDGNTGLLKDRRDFEAFRKAVDDGFVDAFTRDVPLGPTGLPGEAPRQWEAPTAGIVLDLEGPDSEAVTMPPAPPLCVQDRPNPELVFEMAEVYELALLRDVGFADFETGAGNGNDKLAAAIGRLNALPYAQRGFSGRPRLADGGQLTRQTVFRGSTPGVGIGPYLSQFLLIGNRSRNRGGSVTDGLIQYGAIEIDQRVDLAQPGKDFMTAWKSYIEVQNGSRGPAAAFVAPANGRVTKRFMLTPRDLATYVHFDALYEAYLNACIILLGMRTPFDPGFGALSGESPLAGTRRHAAGFALYGGPHILTLVTEVATRALKAVRYQKFNNHMRLRPEALAARIALAKDNRRRELAPFGTLECLKPFADAFDVAGGGVPSLLQLIADHNAGQGGDKAPLLPMAFPEGSPMHPAYGAGHAAVAGACVTILKAFFDTDTVLLMAADDAENISFRRPLPGDTAIAFRPVRQGAEGSALKAVKDAPMLTLEGELNKLAANIAIGRNMAGVHYFSDYYDSLRLGEAVALGILEEQALTYPTDNFVISVPTFDGEVVRIGRR